MQANKREGELFEFEKRIGDQMELVARLIGERAQAKQIEDEADFLKRIIGSYCTMRRETERGRRMDLDRYDGRLAGALD